MEDLAIINCYSYIATSCVGGSFAAVEGAGDGDGIEIGLCCQYGLFPFRCWRNPLEHCLYLRRRIDMDYLVNLNELVVISFELRP